MIMIMIMEKIDYIIICVCLMSAGVLFFSEKGCINSVAFKEELEDIKGNFCITYFTKIKPKLKPEPEH